LAINLLKSCSLVWMSAILSSICNNNSN
jgi:hypothetical protein